MVAVFTQDFRVRGSASSKILDITNRITLYTVDLFCMADKLKHISIHYQQCSKLLPVRLPEADNFGGGPGTFLKIFFNFMFMIWDSRQEDWQLFLLSFEHCCQQGKLKTKLFLIQNSSKKLLIMVCGSNQSWGIKIPKFTSHWRPWSISKGPTTIFSLKMSQIHGSTRLHNIQCINNGDTAVLV